MTALLAATFYWVALADVHDSAHQRALALTNALATSHIVTTDEVLTEYLNFFATAPIQFRRDAARSVERILVSELRDSRHSAEPGIISRRSTSLPSPTR
jgi:hypothetical protein